MPLNQFSNTTFAASSISFQDKWRITDLLNGVNPGDAVAFRQLTPLTQDIQNIANSLGNYVQTAQFGGLFNQYRTSGNLQDKTQVDDAIAAALMGLPEPESRLASVAVATVYQGTIANLTAAVVATFNLVANDSGDIDDSSNSCVLVDSPVTGESGLYQFKSNNQLQKLNSALFAANLGYYSRFYIIDSSREFAIRSIDAPNFNLEVEEIPYVDEFTGLGPITVSNLNKTINLRFSAMDFVMGADGFSLHPSIKGALDLIPTMQSALEALTIGFQDLNTQVSQAITDLTGQVTDLTGTVTSQGQSISALQNALQSIQTKLANAFAKYQEVLFLGGIANVRDGSGNWMVAPNTMVQTLSSDADTAICRVNHDRGTITLPTYFEANQVGEPQMACAIFQLGSLTVNSFEIRIEKYKPVLIVLPAGVSGAAFV